MAFLHPLQLRRTIIKITLGLLLSPFQILHCIKPFKGRPETRIRLKRTHQGVKA